MEFSTFTSTREFDEEERINNRKKTNVFCAVADFCYIGKVSRRTANMVGNIFSTEFYVTFEMWPLELLL